MCRPYLCASDPVEDAHPIAVTDRVRWEFRRRGGAVHDGHAGAACWDFYLASHMYCAFCVDGRLLVVTSEAGEEV